MRLIPILVFAVLLISPASSYSQSANQGLRICSNDKNGDVIIRAKCKKGETTLKSTQQLIRAKAWGFINNGTVDTTRSSANLTARKLSTGLYCVRVTGLSRAEVLPVITPDFSLSACTRNFSSIISSVNSGCESDEFGIINQCFQDAGNPAVQSDFAFSIIVP
jgi:hypothetical protein